MKKLVLMIVFVAGILGSTQAQSLLEISNNLLGTDHKKGTYQRESDYGTIPVKLYRSGGVIYMVKITTPHGSELDKAIKNRHDYDNKRVGSVFVDYWYEQKHPLTYVKEKETDTVISLVTGKKYIVNNGVMNEIKE